jgi:hypothetical protein
MDVKLGLSKQGKKHRLRIFENRLLWRIFGPEKEEVTAGWKKLHNEGFIICTPRP